MSQTTKKLSERDANQTLQASFNDIDSSITTNGFLTGKVGRKITQTISQTTVPGDTATFSFLESGTLLYTLTIVYTDSSQSVMLSAERTA
jgi:hypothetical protein